MTEREVREGWLKAVTELGPVVKGSIKEIKAVCGSKKCKKCLSGERHQAFQMTYYLDGKQHSKYIQKGQLELARVALENGRKLEELMTRFGLEYLNATKAAKKQAED